MADSCYVGNDSGLRETLYLSCFYSILRASTSKALWISGYKLSANLDTRSAVVKVVVAELSAAHLLLAGEMGPLSSQWCDRHIKGAGLVASVPKELLNFAREPVVSWSPCTRCLFKPLEIKFINE